MLICGYFSFPFSFSQLFFIFICFHHCYFVHLVKQFVHVLLNCYCEICFNIFVMDSDTQNGLLSILINFQTFKLFKTFQTFKTIPILMILSHQSMSNIFKGAIKSYYTVSLLVQICWQRQYSASIGMALYPPCLSDSLFLVYISNLFSWTPGRRKKIQ